MTTTATELLDQLTYFNGNLDLAIDAVNQRRHLALTRTAALFIIEQFKVFERVEQVGNSYQVN